MVHRQRRLDMPIKPDDAKQPTKEELREGEELFSYIDEVLRQGYQGKGTICKCHLSDRLPKRVMHVITRAYEQIGWQVKVCEMNSLSASPTIIEFSEREKI